MEKIWEFVKKWTFIYGLVTGFLGCHWYYKEFRIDEIRGKFETKEQALVSNLEARDTDLKTLKNRIDQLEQYEQRYISESARTQTLDRKYSDLLVDNEGLSRRYSDLVSLKWEEKYNAEKLSRIAREEESSLLHQRLKSAESLQATADPQLVKQLTALQDQIDILTNERDGLRKLYAEAPIDGTNSIKNLILSSDYKKKSEFLLSRRAETLNRLTALREQLILTLKSYTALEYLRVLQKSNTMTKAQAEEWVGKYSFTVCRSFCLVEQLYTHFVTETYKSDEMTLKSWLPLSFDDFITCHSVPHGTLGNATKLVASVTALNTEDPDLVKNVILIIENHFSECGISVLCR